MDSKISNESTVQQFIIVDNTNPSVEVFSQMKNIQRTRKILLILLTVMFTFSLFYSIFVSLSCTSYYTYSWLCQYFNNNYEFSWALVSVIYDGIWLLITYRYYSRGLLFFAWISTVFLLIFGIFFVMALVKILRAMIYSHMIATSALIAAISSILVCITPSILQVVIVFFSFKLSILISKMNDSTNC